MPLAVIRFIEICIKCYMYEVSAVAMAEKMLFSVVSTHKTCISVSV